MPCRSSSGSSPSARSRLVDVEDEQQRLGRQELEPAQAAPIVARELQDPQRRARSPGAACSAAGCPAPSRAPRVRVFFRSFASRSSRFSTTARSARISSSSIDRASRRGSTEPAACGIAGSVNARTHVHERVGVAVRRHVEQRVGAGPGRAARDVGELHRGRHPLARVVHRRQDVQPRVGHARHAERGLELAVGRRAAPRAPPSSAWNRVVLPVAG